MMLNKKIPMMVKSKRKGPKKSKTNKAALKALDQQIHLLTMLGSKNRRQKKAMIDTMDGAQMKGVKKIASHLMNAHYPVGNNVGKKIMKDAKFIKQLIHPNTSLKTSKKILQRKGGFLPFLIPAATALLGPVLGSVAGALASKI